MGKNGVKVIIRTRPTAQFATNQILIDQDESTVTVHASSLGSPSKPDIVHGAVVDGVNGTILAYGQTGAGKSFTMIGDTRNYQHRGITPRAIAQVYEEAENRIEIAYSIKVSYMETYNDRIYDLLEHNPSQHVDEGPHKGDFVVVEDAKGTYVRGLTQVEVQSEQEALDQLFHGELQRTVAEHQLNKRSNRSHCIFTFHIAEKSRAGGNERVGESKHLEETISTLKLAQRMMRVQNEVATIVETDPTILLRKYEKQIKELKHELVMHDALVERTGILYDEHTPEQKHQLLKMIRQFVDAPTVEKEDEVLELTSMHEIRELFRQSKLLLKNAESEAEMGGGGVHASSASIRSGSAGSSASRSQTSNGSRSDIYHSGNNNEGYGGSHDEFVGDDDEPGTVGFGLGIVPGAVRPSTMDTAKKAKDAKQGSGQPDGSGGQRSRHRSPSPTRSVVDFSMDERGGDPAAGSNGGSTGSLLTDSDGDNTRDSHAARVKNEAFQFCKSGPGKKLQKNLHEEKDKLFDVKQKAKQISTRLNVVKLQIDKVKGQLEEKRSHRGGNASPTSAKKSAAAGGGSTSRDRNAHRDDQVVVGEEEFILMTAEREAKREYRSLFDDLKDAKSELAFTTRSVELLRMRMVREFEDWYEEEEQSSSLMVKAKDDDNNSGCGVYFARGTRGFASGSKDDRLDDGEKFDQMEVDRIRAQDPDSLAFFQAQKKMRQQQAALGSGGDAKATRKPKRG
ncbi:Kinesin-like protein, partial [Globisporangium splendens]